MHVLDFFKFCPHCGSDQFLPYTKNAKKCHNCGFEYYKNPAIGTGALLFDNKGRLVVTRRAKDPAAGTLDLIGGFVDLGETVEAALLREIREETNIVAEVEEYLFSIPNTYVYKGFDAAPLDFYFKCKIKDMSQILLDETEGSEILFLEEKDINPADFGLPANRQAVERFFKKSH